MDLLPDALVPPSVEVVGDGFPRWEVVGQHAPGAAATSQVQYGVDDLPQRVGAGSADGPSPWGNRCSMLSHWRSVRSLGYRFRAMVFMPKKITLTAHRRKTNF